MTNPNSFIQRQIQQIGTGGIKVLWRKLARLIFEGFVWPIALIATLLIRILEPFILIRTNSLFSSRIGGLSAWTDIYLCEKDAKYGFPTKRFIDIWYHGEKPCNEQMAKMWERTITIFPRWLMSRIAKVQKNLPGGARFLIPPTWSFDPDERALLRRTQPHVQWTDREVIRGWKNIEKLGIAKGENFVCLIVRDNAYLNWWRPNETWAHFDYRNGDIDNYVLAAEALATRDIYTVRMGVKIEKRIPSNNPFVIDYASDGLRTDFMDIFLCAHCKFAIATPVGLDEVQRLFRRPIVRTDFINWRHQINRGDLSIGKHHLDSTRNYQLTWREILELETRSDYSFEVKFYDTNKIKPVYNSPQELLDIVLEMDDRLNHTWVETDFDRELQNRFWTILEESNAQKPGYGVNYGRGISTVSAKYLRDNHQWFLA